MLWRLSSLIFLKKRIQSRGVDAEQFIEPSKANSPSWELPRNREQPSELCGILQHFMDMHELSGIFGGKLIDTFAFPNHGRPDHSKPQCFSGYRPWLSAQRECPGAVG